MQGIQGGREDEEERECIYIPLGRYLINVATTEMSMEVAQKNNIKLVYDHLF